MKKSYIIPEITIVELSAPQLLAGSVADITGNSGIIPTPQPGGGTGGSIPQAPALFDGEEWSFLLTE